MKNGWMTENLHSCLRIPLQQQKITGVCVLLTLCFQLNSVRKLLRKKGKKWLIQNGWWFQCANGNSFIKCCFHGQHVILTKSMIFVRMILLSPIRFISFFPKKGYWLWFYLGSHHPTSSISNFHFDWYYRTVRKLCLKRRCCHRNQVLGGISQDFLVHLARISHWYWKV